MRPQRRSHPQASSQRPDGAGPCPLLRQGRGTVQARPRAKTARADDAAFRLSSTASVASEPGAARSRRSAAAIGESRSRRTSARYALGEIIGDVALPSNDPNSRASSPSRRSRLQTVASRPCRGRTLPVTDAIALEWGRIAALRPDGDADD